MKALRALRRYWRDWRDGTRLDDEIADELRFHLQMIVEEEAHGGASTAEASARARQRFGRLESVLAECRDIHGIGAVDMLRQDLSFGIRMLRRAPAFTAAAILTLALAIGAGTAVFSVVHSVILKPLPYPAADRLVTVSQTKRDGTRGHVAAANWHDWMTAAETVDGLAAWSKWNFTIMGEPEAIRVDGAIVLGPFFDVLGVPAALGRTLIPRDHAGPDGEVVVISDGLWRRRFGGDPSLIGRSIRVGAGTLRVVGVMPAGFAFPAPATEMWAPLSMSPAIIGDRGGEWLRTVGRLTPGVSVDDARAEFLMLARQLEAAYPDVNGGESASVGRLHEDIVGDIRPTLLLLMAAVLLLFLIACVNLGALQLSRGGTRRREMALRTALGATRLRMTRQIVTESVIIAVSGAASGAVLAVVLLRLGLMLAPRDLPRLHEIQLEPSALLFAVTVGAVAVVLFGALPLMRLLRTNLRDDLIEGGHGQTIAPGLVVRQSALVIVQVAFAMVLLVGAGLLFRSFHALASVDPGFDADVMTVRVSLPRSQYRTNEQQAAFFNAIVERIAALPGVASAGAISDLPLVGNNVSFQFMSREGGEVRPADRPLAAVRVVTPAYLETMRIRLTAGRGLAPSDDARAVPIALVNRTLAARQWRGEAIGKQLQINGDTRWLTVVGIVDDVRQLDLAEEEGAAIYVPLAQKQQAFLNWMTLVARGGGGALAGAMRQAVRDVDPDQPAFDARSMRERIDASIATPRIAMAVLLVLAVAAAAIAIVGVYGTISFLVSRRTREIGVRLALGATRADIVTLIMRRASATVCLGLLLGTAGATALARLIGSMLFGVTPLDVATFGAAAASFAAAALLASYVPARRAARIDPLLTMKVE